MSLPSGYKRLEYIQSSGTQYIDTGFKPNQDTRVVCEVNGYSIADNSATNLFGARTSTSSSDQFSFNIAGSTNYRSDYYNSRVGYSTELSFSGKIHIDKNKNVCSIESDGTTYTVTNTQGTFQTPFNLFIFGENRNGSVHSIPNVKLYYFKLYDNGVLIRDFIPCKNASGVAGLWDDVNSVFYQNAGSGKFTAGPEVVGSNRVLVDAKGYDAKSGTVLINGMVYHLKKGRGLLNGMGYDIPFNSRTPISELPVENTVKIAVNGTLRDFLIVHQGLPSSMYDNSCNGTWLLMKDIYEQRNWHRSDVNKLESSTIHSYLNSTFLNLFDSNIKDAIKQVKIPYRKNGGAGGTDQSGANGLSAKIFLLSGYEVGWTTSDSQHFPQDGAKLSYFESGTGTSANNKRIAKLNGSAAYWWLRSPSTFNYNSVWRVASDGRCIGQYAANLNGVRPAFILPSDTLVSDDGTIIM